MNSRKVPEKVKVFYDTYGWVKDIHSHQYHDQLLFKDRDKMVQEYMDQNERRFYKYFKIGGDYFLDAGCGALPRIDFSKNYRKHVCVDISMTGLIEAKNKLGTKGLYIKADLAQLPFKEKSFDGTLASHCLYHVAKDLQSVVLREFYRVTKINKNILVFYSSDYNLLSLFQNIGRVLFRVLGPIVRFLTKKPQKGQEKSGMLPQLYYYTFNPYHLVKDYISVQISCLRTFTQKETKLLRKIRLLKYTLPVFSYLERTFPLAMRYIGRYVAIKIKKRQDYE